MKELMTILGPISYILSENFEKVFFISIIISGIILTFWKALVQILGIVKLIYSNIFWKEK